MPLYQNQFVASKPAGLKPPISKQTESEIKELLKRYHLSQGGDNSQPLNMNHPLVKEMYMKFKKERNKSAPIQKHQEDFNISKNSANKFNLPEAAKQNIQSLLNSSCESGSSASSNLNNSQGISESSISSQTESEIKELFEQYKSSQGNSQPLNVSDNMNHPLVKEMYRKFEKECYKSEELFSPIPSPIRKLTKGNQTNFANEFKSPAVAKPNIQSLLNTSRDSGSSMSSNINNSQGISESSISSQTESEIKELFEQYKLSQGNSQPINVSDNMNHPLVKEMYRKFEKECFKSEELFSPIRNSARGIQDGFKMNFANELKSTVVAKQNNQSFLNSSRESAINNSQEISKRPISQQTESEIKEILERYKLSQGNSQLLNVLDNMNHPLVKEMYQKFEKECFTSEELFSPIRNSAGQNQEESNQPPLSLSPVKKSKSKDNSIRKKSSVKEEYLKTLEEMKMLQSQRNVGLYVLCDRCDKMRFLSYCVDPLDLPDKWYCENDNKTCSEPQAKILPEVEADLIDNLYNAGSVVWAKPNGWPWWPAMVDDDPDYLKYYWLVGNSNVPTKYNVTFFDSADVTKTWLKPKCIAPFRINMTNPKFLPQKTSKFFRRISVAIKQAIEAQEMKLSLRLEKFSFISRFQFEESKMVEINNEKENNDYVANRRVGRKRASKNIFQK